MKDDSKCPKGIYCEFEQSRNLPDAVIEICARCGKKVIYNKGEKGRIDNDKYRRDHYRDFVQPYGATKKLFIKLWGTKPIEDANRFQEGKLSKLQREQMIKENQEKRVFMRRKALGHPLITDEDKPLPRLTKTFRNV